MRGLRLAEDGNKLADGQLGIGQQRQQAQARRLPRGGESSQDIVEGSEHLATMRHETTYKDIFMSVKTKLAAAVDKLERLFDRWGPQGKKIAHRGSLGRT